MTLERNWDKDPWMHTRTNLESFDPNGFAIKRDYERNKLMKKLIRKRKKSLRKSKSPKQ